MDPVIPTLRMESKLEFHIHGHQWAIGAACVPVRRKDKGSHIRGHRWAVGAACVPIRQRDKRSHIHGHQWDHWHPVYPGDRNTKEATPASLTITHSITHLSFGSGCCILRLTNLRFHSI